MSTEIIANGIQTTVASVTSPTVLVLAAGVGAKLPATTGGYAYRAVMQTGEIVLVTNRATDTITITRAQEGTTQVPITAGMLISVAPITAGGLNATYAALNAANTYTGDQTFGGNNFVVSGTTCTVSAVNITLSASSTINLSCSNINLSGGTTTVGALNANSVAISGGLTVASGISAGVISGTNTGGTTLDLTNDVVLDGNAAGCIQLSGRILCDTDGSNKIGWGSGSSTINFYNSVFVNIYSVTASYFYGDGTNIINIKAANIVPDTSGSVPTTGLRGERVTSQIVQASAVSLTSGTAKTVTSISLTAGTWIITGSVDFQAGSGTTTTLLQGGSSSTTNTLGSQDTFFSNPFAIATTATDASAPIPGAILYLTATTTIYLVAKAIFAVSTLKAYGTITATRF